MAQSSVTLEFHSGVVRFDASFNLFVVVPHSKDDPLPLVLDGADSGRVPGGDRRGRRGLLPALRPALARCVGSHRIIISAPRAPWRCDGALPAVRPETKIIQGWPKLRDLAQHFD